MPAIAPAASRTFNRAAFVREVKLPPIDLSRKPGND